MSLTPTTHFREEPSGVSIVKTNGFFLTAGFQIAFLKRQNSGFIFIDYDLLTIMYSFASIISMQNFKAVTPRGKARETMKV